MYLFAHFHELLNKSKSGKLSKNLDLSGTKLVVEKILEDGSTSLEVVEDLPEDIVLEVPYDEDEEDDEALGVAGGSLLEILQVRLDDTIELSRPSISFPLTNRAPR